MQYYREKTVSFNDNSLLSSKGLLILYPMRSKSVGMLHATQAMLGAVFAG